MTPEFAELESKLLAIAPGCVGHTSQSWVLELLQHGAIIAGESVTVIDPADKDKHACHYYAALQWLCDPTAQIYTGMAYSVRGAFWSPHSWNMRGAEIIDAQDHWQMRFGVLVSNPVWFMRNEFSRRHACNLGLLTQYEAEDSTKAVAPA